ncbi:phosphatase PAP2 family protein [Streptomyces sp. NPDC056470]|uniref:phosphatase PAP2 family protein n=1 Tax=unclassified Streptomyces TaxID=2593676 RepID=UPI0036B21FBF
MIPHDDVEDRLDSSSFPSGRTAAAVGFTTAVAVGAPWWAAAAAVPTAMVAFERVHSGARYPSDIAAGAALGTSALPSCTTSPACCSATFCSAPAGRVRADGPADDG